jgi:uncharacterized protein YjlB
MTDTYEKEWIRIIPIQDLCREPASIRLGLVKEGCEVQVGAVIILPGNTSHFHWAKSGDYITQVTAIGPLGIEYVDSNDDPRTKKVGQ